MASLAPPRDVLRRTPIYRMVHIDNLDTLLRRGVIHAPSARPDDGLSYTGIHDAEVRFKRASRVVPCGPRGAIEEYVGFYFGPRSPMLYRVHTGWDVRRVSQEEIVYLVTFAQSVAEAGAPFVFTDRHSLAALAAFSDSLDDLAMVDFDAAYALIWKTTADHPDRQEKKQAEFLVHQALPWDLIKGVGVLNHAAAARVQAVINAHADKNAPPIVIRPNW